MYVFTFNILNNFLIPSIYLVIMLIFNLVTYTINKIQKCHVMTIWNCLLFLKKMHGLFQKYLTKKHLTFQGLNY